MGVLVRDGLYERTKDGEGPADSGKTGPEKLCTKEELEFLKLREQLKTAKRENLRKLCGSLPGCPPSENKLPSDSFGSFFGPSRPAIAQRVIQESKGSMKLLDIQNLTKKASNSHGKEKKARLTESKTKAQKIKESRDYSFLFSENAEVLIDSEKGQITTGQSDQPTTSGKQSINKVTVACKPQHTSQPREGFPAKKLFQASTSPRKQLEAISNSGIAEKHVVQGGFDAKRPTPNVETTCGKNFTANNRAAVPKANTLMGQQLEGKKQDGPAGNKKTNLMQNLIVCSLKHNVLDKRKVAMSTSLAATKKLLKRRKEIHSRLKPSPSKSYVTIQHPGREAMRIDNASLIKKKQHPVLKHQAPDAHKISLIGSQSEAKKQLSQEKKFPGPEIRKMTANQMQSYSPNQAPISHRAPLSKSRLATKESKEHEIGCQKPVNAKIKRPRQVLSDEEKNYEDVNPNFRARVSEIIQGLFRKRRNTEDYYTQSDYSNGECAVATFNELEKEERKSARIGRKEDAIELKRILEEERENGLRRKAKKQKLEQN